MEKVDGRKCRRRINSNCKRLAKCGKTSLYVCQRKPNLPECKNCTLVRRIYSNYKKVNGVHLKRCIKCGEWLPLDNFYKTWKKKDSGKVYLRFSSKCMNCYKIKDND